MIEEKSKKSYDYYIGIGLCFGVAIQKRNSNN